MYQSLNLPPSSDSSSIAYISNGECLRTEFVKAEDENRFVDLETEDFRLDEGERLSIDLDEALSCLAVCDSFFECVSASCGFYYLTGFLRHTSRRLLLAEALDTLS
jgi:hypothetical protein